MIVALTYFTSLMVILTKWFDCTTTLKHINGVAMESNPIARALMYRFGIKGTVWFAFIVSIVATVLSQFYVQVWTQHYLWDVSYIVIGLFTALIQGATALNNYQGKPNFITNILLKVVSRTR
ncbi:hypothetical protein N9M75_03490 [Schleiferiaceae bacterium]|nr:hypothetical protein [Schleiferiaceae bacterium]